MSRIGEYCTHFERKCVLILARNEGKHALDLNINKLGKEQSWEMDLMRKQKWLESESEGSIQEDSVWAEASSID